MLVGSTKCFKFALIMVAILASGARVGAAGAGATTASSHSSLRCPPSWPIYMYPRAKRAAVTSPGKVVMGWGGGWFGAGGGKKPHTKKGVVASFQAILEERFLAFSG